MEKKLTVKFQKLLSSPVFPPGTFVEALKFERVEGDVNQRRGTLFCLITLSGPKDFDAPVFGRAIFDTLEEEYFNDSSLPPLSCLERAAFSAHRRLVGMTLSAHLTQGVDFNLALAVSWGQVLYLCRLGSAGAYLLRDGKVSEVTMGDETLVSCASGFIYDGDTVILGSKDFKARFPVDTIAGNLLKLEEKMQEIGDKASLAALVLKMEIEEHPTAVDAINFVDEKQASPRLPGLKTAALNPSNGFGVFRRFGKKLSGGLKIPSSTPARTFHKKLLSKKAVAPAIFVLIFAAFLVSVYYTILAQARAKMATISRETFSQADLDLVNASDLIGLNDLKAQEILDKTLKDLKSLEKLGSKDPKLAQYISRTQELWSRVSKESPVAKPVLVYDFSLAEKNIKPTNLAGIKDNLFTASSQSGAVFSLKIASPADTQRVDSGKLTAPFRVSAFGDRVFVFAKTGVSVIKLKTKEFSDNVVPSESLSNFYDFASYNSNLYFLDTSGSRIMRSLYGDSGYSKPSNWLKEPVDISKAVNFTLNGSVYVLLDSGKVLKFEGGKLSDFSVSGYSKTLSKNTYIYTGSGLDYVYLVDKDNKKVVQFTESGVYQKTYDFGDSGVASISSLYVNSDNMNLYILSETKVYEVQK